MPSLPPMASAVAGVRATTIVMRQPMTSFTGPHILQLIHVLSLLVLFARMVRDLMGSQWWPGRVVAPRHLAHSYLALATLKAGAAVAAHAEKRKVEKYTSITSNPYLMFVPMAIETTGVFGPNAQSFLKEPGHRLSVVTGEQRSYSCCRGMFSIIISVFVSIYYLWFVHVYTVLYFC